MLCLFCGALHALAEILQYGETLHIYIIMQQPICV